MSNGKKPIIVVCASVKNLPKDTILLGLMDVLQKLENVKQAWERGADTTDLYTAENGFSWGDRYLVTDDFLLYNPQFFDVTDDIIYITYGGTRIHLKDLTDAGFMPWFFGKYDEPPQKLAIMFPAKQQYGGEPWVVKSSKKQK